MPNNTKQLDTLNMQTYAEENQNKQNSSKLIHREPITNTPFWIIGNEQTGYFITIKDFRITEIYKTIQEAKECLVKEQWNIITRLIPIVYEIMIKEIIKEEKLTESPLNTRFK